MQDSQPMFSLVVPIYNVEAYLEECLDSIASQTNRDFEVILVDDGSTDSSGKVADAFQKENAGAFPIHVIHQANRGLSAARNCGIAHASGTYVLCVDSDDYIISGTLESLQRKLDEAPYDMVFFRFQTFSTVKNEHIKTGSFPNAQSVGSKDALTFLFSKRLESYAWSFVAKRELYRNIHFPVGRNYEDKATTYRLIADSKKIGLLNEPLYRYRLRLGSIVHKMSAADVDSELKNCSEQRAFLERSYPELLDLQSSYYAYELLIDYWKCSYTKSLSSGERRRLQRILSQELHKLAVLSGTSNWGKGMRMRYMLMRLHVLAPIQRFRIWLRR